MSLVALGEAMWWCAGAEVGEVRGVEEADEAEEEEPAEVGEVTGDAMGEDAASAEWGGKS